MRARASERRWKVLVQQSREAEKLLANEPYSVEDGGDTWCTMRTAGSVGTGAGLGGSSGAATGATICTKLWNLWSRMSGSCSWHTHTPTAKLISRCVAVVCALVSVVILWSELVMASQMRSPVGLVSQTTSHILSTPHNTLHPINISHTLTSRILSIRINPLTPPPPYPLLP